MFIKKTDKFSLGIRRDLIKFLKIYYKFEELPKDFQVRNKATTEEECYLIHVAGNLGILVGSGIFSTDRVEDEIRIIPVEIKMSKKIVTLKLISNTEKMIKRTINWKEQFEKKTAAILVELGYKMKCPKCGNILFLKLNKKKGKPYIGCSNYIHCSYSKAAYNKMD